MYRMEHLTQQERDSILSSLNEKQQRFITAHLKRGRKTVFANILAKGKAGLDPIEENSQIAEGWELIDYIDAGPGWQSNPKYFCECGRPLRYQYVLQNTQSGEIKRFGINHFQEHTGISPQLARAIVKGIESIDYEMDEILIKISMNWSLADTDIDGVPPVITIPDDIQSHLDSEIPLLDRQVKRLKQQIAAYWKEVEEQSLRNKIRAEEQEEKQRVKDYQELKAILSANIASGQVQINTGSSLNDSLQIGMLTYLYSLSEPIVSAREASESLVAYHGASSQTFSSGTLRIYPDVCSFLEALKAQGFLEFVEKIGLKDRIYKRIKLPQLPEARSAEQTRMMLFEDD